ncbi:MAG: diguanylate cyclase [Myxococcaceae bacterium]|nr:diguanylate cyclase [Myxococcaceae bacterium]
MTARDRPRIVVAESSGAGGVGRSLEPWYDVVTTSSGKQAVAHARELSPDLVLLSAGPKESDGVGAAVRLLCSSRTEHIPVLILADPYDDADAVRCLDLGVTDYLSRAISTRELVARIEKAIREMRFRRELAELARTDALTGLANFRALMARMAEEFSRAVRYEYPLSAVMIDLDHLKQINDRFGHDIGNKAILALTRTLRASLRQTDFAARFGGDEFVVLLPHQTPSEAAVMVERLRRTLSTVRIEGPNGRPIDFTLTLSAGVAGHAVDDPRPSFEALLQLSDAALYQAKRTGRDRVVVCERRSQVGAQGMA